MVSLPRMAVRAAKVLLHVEAEGIWREVGHRERNDAVDGEDQDFLRLWQ